METRHLRTKERHGRILNFPELPPKPFGHRTLSDLHVGSPVLIVRPDVCLALLCVHKNPVKEVIDQGRLRGTFLGQELGNLELVNSAMAGCLPFVPDDQTFRPALKDQAPNVFVSRPWPTCASIKLALEDLHCGSLRS
jgi:hypothetical protein